LEPQAETEEARGEIDINEVERYKELFLQRLAFSYRYKALEKVPAKLSVSDLYPSILDEGEGEGALEIRELSVDDALAITGAGMPDQPEVQKFKPPRFLSEEPETATAAERGTATHIFMQFCDFDFVEQYGIKAELERLVARKFMTPRTRSLSTCARYGGFSAAGFTVRCARQSAFSARCGSTCACPPLSLRRTKS